MSLEISIQNYFKQTDKRSASQNLQVLQLCKQTLKNKCKISMKIFILFIVF